MRETNGASGVRQPHGISAQWADPAWSRRSGVVCAGNWIADVVHVIDSWPSKNDLTLIREEVFGVGGGAANVITDLARFEAGLPLTPVGKLGDDAFAGMMLDHCRALGLSTDFLARTPGQTTAHTHVMSVPGDSRTFFHHGGVNDTFGPDDVPVADLAERGARLFYLGYVMLLPLLDRLDSGGSTPAARVLAQARSAGMMTCVDLVSADRPDFADVVAASLPHIDYLVLNEVEAERASKVRISHRDGTVEPDRLETAAQALLEGGVHQAVIAHAPDVAVWVDRQHGAIFARPVPAAASEIISPVGAGDAFCAGILFAVHEGLDPSIALKLANSAARCALASPTATDGIPPIRELMPEYRPRESVAADAGSGRSLGE